MSKIKGKNTKPELVLKDLLDGRIFRYHPKGITGNPDFGNKKRKIALFVDGCFWHGCTKCKNIPQTNTHFWAEKLKRNKERDTEVGRILENEGYLVIRIWEHEIKEDLEKVKRGIQKSIR
jgi:DNA mismatch endonuclease (patch repair protein)